jgi:recombination protein RecR
MSKFAEPMARLIDELKKLPGVGSKSAQRYAFHILRGSDEDAEQLAGAIREIKAALRLCSVCNNITDVDPCVYCSSPTRNHCRPGKGTQLQRRIPRAARHALTDPRGWP